MIGNYFKHTIVNEGNNFLLNHIADVCLSPLHGIMQICGKESRVFYYSSAKNNFSEHTTSIFSGLNACKKVIACVLLILCAIPLTPIGCIIKAIALCNSDLQNLYKKLFSSIEFCKPKLLNAPLPKGQKDHIFSKEDLFMCCVLPYLGNAKDLTALACVSKASWELMNTPVVQNTYAAFFFIQPSMPLSLHQHMKNVFLGTFGNYTHAPELASVLGCDKISVFRIPIAHRIQFDYDLTKERHKQLLGWNSFYAKIGTLKGLFLHPPAASSRLWQNKMALHEIQCWCKEQIRFKQLPSIFRLQINGRFKDGLFSSENECDEEVFIVKYTFLFPERRYTVQGNRVIASRMENTIRHEYLVLKYFGENWYCIDSRALNALVEKNNGLCEHIQRFSPLFYFDYANPLCLHSTKLEIENNLKDKEEFEGLSDVTRDRLERIPAWHDTQLRRLKALMKGKSIPFHASEIDMAMSALEARDQFRYLVRIGHRSLEEMEALLL